MRSVTGQLTSGDGGEGGEEGEKKPKWVSYLLQKRQPIGIHFASVVSVFIYAVVGGLGMSLVESLASRSDLKHNITSGQMSRIQQDKTHCVTALYANMTRMVRLLPLF